jgi:N-carbamoylputrescine amidase
MNHVYVAVANRIGASGRHEFIGRSHVAAPNGELLAQAPDEEMVVTHALDLEWLGKFRRSQNYWLRDRRPETYGDLTKNLV